MSKKPSTGYSQVIKAIRALKKLDVACFECPEFKVIFKEDKDEMVEISEEDLAQMQGELAEPQNTPIGFKYDDDLVGGGIDIQEDDEYEEDDCKLQNESKLQLKAELDATELLFASTGYKPNGSLEGFINGRG